jgi:hypothetical protein
MPWAEEKTKTSASKGKGKSGRAWLWVLFFIIFVYLFWSGRSNKDLHPNPNVGQQSEEVPVKAYTAIQSAQGATESDLDGEALKGIEGWFVHRVKEKYGEYFAEIGLDPNDIKELSSSSLYVMAEGKKLAVIKIWASNVRFKAVIIMGIEGTDAIRVHCFRRSNQEISVWHGVCGDEVRKSLGVTIQP